MASAKYVKALASRKIKLRKAPRTSGEVALVFRPLYDQQTGKTVQPKTISIGWTPMEPLKRTDVSLDNIRHSNLEQLVGRRAVVLLDV